MHRRTFLAALAGVVVTAKRSFAMTTGLKREWIQHTRLPESEWVYPDLEPSIYSLAKAAGAADTSIFPQFPAFFHTGDIVHCPRTGENMRVLHHSFPGVVVMRGVGCVPCAMVEEESIWILGSASHEGATSERVPIEPDVWPQDEREQFVEKAPKIYQRGVRNSFSDAIYPARRPREYLSKKELEDFIGEPL